MEVLPGEAANLDPRTERAHQDQVSPNTEEDILSFRRTLPFTSTRANIDGNA